MNRWMMSRMVELLLASLVLAGISWWVEAREAFAEMEVVGPGEVTVAGARVWGDAVLWVDVRSRDAWEGERIADAVWLNEGEFEAGMEAFLMRWNPEVPVVVYCDGQACDASAAVADRLRNEFGMENVWVLKGGWEAWKR